MELLPEAIEKDLIKGWFETNLEMADDDHEGVEWAILRTREDIELDYYKSYDLTDTQSEFIEQVVRNIAKEVLPYGW